MREHIRYSAAKASSRTVDDVAAVDHLPSFHVDMQSAPHLYQSAALAAVHVPNQFGSTVITRANAAMIPQTHAGVLLTTDM